MKILLKSYCLLCFILLSGAASAFTGGEAKKAKPENETEIVQQQEGKNQKAHNASSVSGGHHPDKTEQQEVDSANNDSVSKYNFIFYFLYKFNYSKGQEFDIF